MRLIDADALEKAIRHDIGEPPCNDWDCGLYHAIPIVRSQPTVDALALLKEQKPVAVYESKISRCACGSTVNRYWHPKFCGYCGKELMWY